MMRKSDRVVREILYRFYERNEPFMSQKSLAQACRLSMDTVNRLVTKLHRFHSINKKPLGFRVTDPTKVLAYWAATRDLHKDIVYSTYSSDSMSEIEAGLPKEAVFTAFSGYKARFGAGPTSAPSLSKLARTKLVGYERCSVGCHPDKMGSSLGLSLS